LGYTEQKCASPEVQEKSLQKLAVEARLAKRRSSDCLDVPVEAEPVDGEDLVPSKYYTIGALSRNLLRDKALPGVEPNNCSAANLRKSIDPLGCAASKREYLRLWQFTTGRDTEFGLTGAMRWLSEVRTLGFQRSLLRGRRALTIGLPTDWPREGIFKICSLNEEGTEVQVMQRFTLQTVWVPREKLPRFEVVDLGRGTGCMSCVSGLGSNYIQVDLMSLSFKTVKPVFRVNNYFPAVSQNIDIE
jgi:hypothetical protein